MKTMHVLSCTTQETRQPSVLVMPMPESSIVRVELVLSGMILMKKFGWASHGGVVKIRGPFVCASFRGKNRM